MGRSDEVAAATAMSDEAPAAAGAVTRPVFAGRPRWWGYVAAGLLHALLMWLAFPPEGWWPAAFLAPAPLCWAALRAGDRPARAGLLVALGVMPLWIVDQRWLLDVAGLWYVLLAAYLAAYSGLFVWLVGAWRKRAGRLGRVPAALVLAIAWTAIEVLRGEVVIGGYAWFLAAHPLIDGVGASAAAVLGTYFVSFCLVGLVGVVVAWLSQRQGSRRALVVVGASILVAWVAVAMVGRSSLKAHSPAEARIALVQTNLPQDNKESWPVEQRLKDFDHFLELTRQAAASNPDLIAWPETMFPGIALDDQSFAAERAANLSYRLGANGEQRVPSTVFRDRLVEVQRELGVPILVGAIGYEGLKITLDDRGRPSFKHDAKFNSAFLIRDGRVEPGRYDKLELMAFGETVPYVSRWMWAKNMVAKLSGVDWVFDLDWGRRAHVFTLDVPARDGRPAGRVGFVTPICFEGTMSRVVRRLVLADAPGGERAEFILNISNDGWFGRYAGGREQHLLTMRWRAVETGLPVLRAVNTGISAAVAPGGSLMRPPATDARPFVLPPHTDGVLVVDLPVAGPASTVFARIGNAFGWACTIVAGLGVVWMMLPARYREAAKTPATRIAA